MPQELPALVGLEVQRLAVQASTVQSFVSSQSVFCKHCAQLLVAVLQSGVAPPQLPLLLHSTHEPAALHTPPLQLVPTGLSGFAHDPALQRSFVQGSASLQCAGVKHD